MAKEKISSLAREKLKKLSGDAVVGLDDIRKNMKLMASVIELTRSIIDEERDMILAMDSADPVLSTKHANAKGRVAGLTFFVHMIKGAGDELERREDKE